ncbi:MAG TPA: 2-hydroxychromene-2-carboxylate isomerase [Pseudomonadota bacterium]|nr:2-hydroxychromene-2-carboxylate isomerase [Pseudomonadota bacterium]
MPIPLPAHNSAFGDRHQGGARPEFRFYFDIVCPYAYLASTQVEGFAERLGARIDHRPILLGGVLKSLASTPAAGPPAKQAMTRVDVARWAQHFGVELQFPAEHPRRTVEAMRLLTWAPRLSIPSLMAALYRAYWVEGRDIADVEVLLDIAESVGLLRSEAQKGLLSPAVSQELRRQTDAAIADGVFGVPTFIVEGESGPRLFFGQDRLIFVEEALRSHPLMRDEGSTRPPRAVAPTPIGEYGAQVANQARKLTFVYDLSSPFAYLASTQVEKLAAACGAEVEFFPILLGGLFRSIGTPMVPISTYPESKRRHALEDMSRWAHHYGVSFHFPSRFPINTVAALRLLLLAGDNIAPLTHTLFRLYWVGDQDLGDVQVLERALAEVGLDPRLVDRVGEPEVKAKLLANTKQAEEWGCFGVPSFLVAQHHGKAELFFGQDRLLFVEKALRRGTSH